MSSTGSRPLRSGSPRSCSSRCRRSYGGSFRRGPPVLEIDGSYGEGGGQIARMAVALSALTTTPIRLVNVRAKRKKPGLAAQHATAIRAVAGLCDARIEDVRVGSNAFSFDPGPLHGGRFSLDIGPAGPVTLLLQASLPA